MNRVFAWPVGQTGERRRTLETVLLSIGATAGGLMGGVATALVAYGIRSAPLPARYVALTAGVLVIIGAVQELRGRFRPFPQLARQVNRYRLRGSNAVVALAFGIELGIGYLTYVKHAAIGAFVVLALVVGTPQSIVLAGLAFGLARSAVPLAHLVLTAPETADAIERRLIAVGSAKGTRMILASIAVISARQLLSL